MEDKTLATTEKKSLWKSRKSLKTGSKIYLIVMHLFALTGLAIVGAWALYQTGITNNKGSVDKNNRYLADYHARYSNTDTASFFESNLQNYINLSLLNKVYPVNAHLIFESNVGNPNPNGVDRMLYALNLYLKDDAQGKKYQQMLDEINKIIDQYNPKQSQLNAIPWMNDSGWIPLKKALIKDSAAIRQAAEMTGVDARLIVACTVGEQIRLFNSKREDYKRYLGPAVLSVESQFSYGVTGIKLFTAEAVERNLKDTQSPFYMGEKYENILDYSTEDIENERIDRLTSYRNHLYSFIYTGCILRQTMLQWKRAGYDISDRPDILCTLFNLGFWCSKPKENPRCGGSHVSVGGVTYTFGVLGNDFFYSGELSDIFPMPSGSYFTEQ